MGIRGRTLLLPPSLSDYGASSARFEDGSIVFAFEPAAMTETPSPIDPLAELREQIRATTEAAERLAAETAEARAGAQHIPPAGWATPDEQAARQQELQALIVLVGALRDLVPDELKQLVRDVLRQLLLLVRALVDWWVERMEGPDARGPGGGDGPERPIG